MNSKNDPKYRNPLFVYMVGGVFWVIGTQIEHELLSLFFAVIAISLTCTAFVLYFKK